MLVLLTCFRRIPWTPLYSLDDLYKGVYHSTNHYTTCRECFMKHSKRKRTLSFEQLESKCAPSTLLLVLAPMEDSIHVAVEQSRADLGSAQIICAEVNTSASWQFQFSTSDLLRFVDDNTSCTASPNVAAAVPTAEQCRGADEMMKLGDQDLRALVIADTLHHS